MVALQPNPEELGNGPGRCTEALRVQCGRPAEPDPALRLYRDDLNRMTRADLVDALAGANVGVVTITRWSQLHLVLQLAADVLRDIQRLYPRAVADELLATFVTVSARRS